MSKDIYDRASTGSQSAPQMCIRDRPWPGYPAAQAGCLFDPDSGRPVDWWKRHRLWRRPLRRPKGRFRQAGVCPACRPDGTASGRWPPGPPRPFRPVRGRFPWRYFPPPSWLRGHCGGVRRRTAHLNFRLFRIVLVHWLCRCRQRS